MLNKFFNRPILVILVIILLILTTLPFQKKIDNQRSKFRSIEKTLFVSSATLKKISLGFTELLADIYWFRSLQYFGSKDVRFAEKNPDLLFNYFDIITDLDSKFINAYRFGGSFLAEPMPHGLGDLDKGALIFDKGRKNNPENFRLPLEEAFLFYLHTDNYSKAADLFEEASSKSSLSDFRRASFKGMAASARIRGGDRELSKKIWEDIYNNTTNEGRKNFALENLGKIQSMDFEDKLTELAKKYESKYGKFPQNLDSLLKIGYLKKIPKDHEGKNFIVSTRMKKVKSIGLLNNFFNENIGFLNSKSIRFKNNFNRYPINILELKTFIEQTSKLRPYPEHPLGEEYIYNQETGEVSYDKWW